MAVFPVVAKRFRLVGLVRVGLVQYEFSSRWCVLSQSVQRYFSEVLFTHPICFS